MRVNWIHRSFLSMLAVLFSCQLQAEPQNLNFFVKDLIHYHDSGAYTHELNQVAAKAQTYLEKRIVSNEKGRRSEKLAIVLDIDETSLSNYDQMLQRDFSSDLKRIHRDMLAAKAKVVSPILQLVQEAQAHHVSVFFVTGRRNAEKIATILNLHRAGYQHWTGIYFKPDNYHERSVIPFKSGVRAQLVKQGYTIVETIGDQWSDISGGYAEKGFKLPNPYYFLP